MDHSLITHIQSLQDTVHVASVSQILQTGFTQLQLLLPDGGCHRWRRDSLDNIQAVDLWWPSTLIKFYFDFISTGLRKVL